MKRSLVIFIILSSLASIGQQELSLSQAITNALQNNFQVRISNLNTRIAENNNTWGAAGALPSLDLTITNVNMYDNSESYNLDTSTYQISTYESEFTNNSIAPSLTLNWILFSGFRISTTKDNFQALQELSEGNAAIVVENTLQSVVLGYYKALLEQKKLDIVHELMKLSKDRYDYLLTKKELGSAVTYDVLQAKNAFLTDSSNVLLQQMNVRAAMMNLNQLLGESTGQDYILSDEFPIYLNEYKLGELITKLTNNNKTIRNQYINQRILKNSAKLAQSSMYPTLSLRSGIDAGKSWLKADFLEVDLNNHDYYATFVLSWNLYNGGKTLREIKNARIEEEIALLQTEEMTNSLTILLTTMYDFYMARKQLYNVAEENLKSTELNLELSSDKFKAGTINSFNYRDIQIMYMNASFGRLEAIYNLIDTHTELLRLTGGIVEEMR